MKQWEVFVNTLDELRDDQTLELSIRSLDPGIYKYAYKRVRAKVSANPEQYADRLSIRFGRGQPYDKPYSIEIVEEVQLVPEKYMPRLVSREM